MSIDLMPTSVGNDAKVSDSISREGLRPIRVLTMATVDVALNKLLTGIMNALREEGFISEAASADGPHAKQLRQAGFEVHAISFQRRVLTLAHFKAFFQIYNLMRRRRYDIVHVHTPFAQVLGRIAARCAGVPVVLYTSHGFQFHESRRPWARAAILRMERWLGRWTDVVFTQSQEDADAAVREMIADRDRVVWIGNGIDLSQFGPEPSDPTTRQEFGFRADDRVIVFIGRIVREKGILELIEAMSWVHCKLPASRLLIIGDTKPDERDTEAKGLVRELIRAKGLDHVIHFAGFRDDVPRILRAADLMVLPSWREGMPRSIIEAMAIGLPVVATDIRGCREEVVNGETGLLVPSRDPARLAKAIVEVLSNPDRAQRMGRQGRKRALQHFDERAVLKRQLQVYRRLIEAKRLANPPSSLMAV